MGPLLDKAEPYLAGVAACCPSAGRLLPPALLRCLRRGGPHAAEVQNGAAVSAPRGGGGAARVAAASPVVRHRALAVARRIPRPTAGLEPLGLCSAVPPPRVRLERLSRSSSDCVLLIPHLVLLLVRCRLAWANVEAVQRQPRPWYHPRHCWC
eukprot:16412-Chlamydomonas_euryale.AAC.5